MGTQKRLSYAYVGSGSSLGRHVDSSLQGLAPPGASGAILVELPSFRGGDRVQVDGSKQLMMARVDCGPLDTSNWVTPSSERS